MAQRFLLNRKHHVGFVLLVIALSSIAAIFLLALGRNRTFDSSNRAPTSTTPPRSQRPKSPITQQEAPGNSNENFFLHDIAKLCFLRDDYIYLYYMNTSETKRVAKGRDPEISPRGTAIAFTEGMPQPYGNTRTIKIFELESNRIIEFKSLAGIYSFSPMWSHNGNMIAFDMVLENRAHVGVINLADGTLDDLSRNVVTNNLRFDSWLDGDKSVICHDLKNIYEIALDGRLLQGIPIRNIINESNISTGTRFYFSADRRYLLFDGHRDPENEAIYLYDFATSKLSALTPETIEARGARWLPGEKGFVFSRVIENGNHLIYNISIMAIDGTEIETIVPNAAGASYSTN